MTNFFYLTGVNDVRFGAGYLRGDNGAISEVLQVPGPVLDWAPVVFDLKSGGLCDYQPNNVVGCRLCSGRLRAVLDQGQSAYDKLEWLPAQVVDAEGCRWPYWILRFPGQIDVLNKEKTTYVLGTDVVVKPYFDVKTIAAYHVFSYPGAALVLVVSSEVRQAIVQARCTGVKFSKALIA